MNQDRPPALREHRLYQADWLFRFYDFAPGELATEEDGNLSLTEDPKLAWALRNREFYPVDVNAASREALLRVPGLGVKNAERILRLRRFHKVTLDDLRRLRVSVRKALPFLVAADAWDASDPESTALAARLRRPAQLELFEAETAAITGQF
jgi:predicted DNA-binding helix-hairpin-helix protein